MANERLAALIFRLGRDSLPTGVIEEHVRVVEESHPLPTSQERLNFGWSIFQVAMVEHGSEKQALGEVLRAIETLGEPAVYEPAAEHLGEWAREISDRLTENQ